MRYDPMVAPDPQKWLALDEQERILLVQRYHEREPARPPSPTLHAAFHAIVENQLALLDDCVTATLTRLTDEGLDRHESLHAIGSVLAECMIGALRDTSSAGDFSATYYRELADLNARAWSHGEAG